MEERQEKFTPEVMKSKRKAKDLTLTQLAKISGTSMAMLSKYETGYAVPSLRTWKRILTALKRNRPLDYQDTWQRAPDPAAPPPPKFTFEAEHNYVIKIRNIKSEPLFDMQPSTGFGCVFKYEGKRGIHHCFRELYGGWSRTYTDAQLIDKTIEEVKT